MGWTVPGRGGIACLVLGLATGTTVAAEEGPREGLLGAARRGDRAEVARLLEEGAPPDRGDRSGWTALHQAAEAGDAEIARLLLEAGAAPDLRSRARGTALDVAERGGQVAVARVLRLHGARGSGKSVGDTVCVRRWGGEGYCARVEGVDPTRHRLRVTSVIGCATGCPAEPVCSAGRWVGAGGLSEGDSLWVPTSCLTHTGVKPR